VSEEFLSSVNSKYYTHLTMIIEETQNCKQASCQRATVKEHITVAIPTHQVAQYLTLSIHYASNSYACVPQLVMICVPQLESL
jgi:hypothetical protein